MEEQANKRRPKAGDKYKPQMAEKLGVPLEELYPEMAGADGQAPASGGTPKVAPPPKRNKEEEKRAATRHQIRRNQNPRCFKVPYKDTEIDAVEVFPIFPYSTKFMSTDDQFTLAVDKVGFPEFKIALLPAVPDDAHYRRGGAEFWDYSSQLSLNDGDKQALARLLTAFKDGQHRSFCFDNPNGEDVEIIAYMYSGTAKLIQFNFDMYHGDVFSGVSGVPGITASFILKPREEDNPYEEYTSKLEWDYLLTIHRNNPETPRDSELKPEYELFQKIPRAAIVTLGILPSKLDLEGSSAHESRSSDFADIGAAIQLR